MGDSVAEMVGRGEEPIDEHQPVLRTGTRSTPSQPRGQLGLMTLMPQRAQLGVSDQLLSRCKNPVRPYARGGRPRPCGTAVAAARRAVP